MFNSSHKARIDGFDCRIRRQAGNNEEQSYARLRLLFEFTPEIAAEIGGPAPRIYDALAQDYDGDGLGAVPIRLNASAVNVRFRVDNKYHVVQNTIALTMRAQPPTATNLQPMLAVRVSFLAGENDIAMLWSHMGEHVGVRMDRQQLELPGMAREPQEQAEAAG